MTAAPTVERECPACGSPAAAAQDYCLECGRRLPPAPSWAGEPVRRLRAGGPAWALLATGVVALVAAAAVAAVELTRAKDRNVLIATSPQPAVLPAAESVAAPAASVPASPPERTEPAATQPSGKQAGGLIQWPTGTNGWTLVLASIPAAQANRAVARRQAQKALDDGLPQVGVLDSSRFASLHPGYLVVFSGIYPDRPSAEHGLSRARVAGYQAYARQIVR